MWSFILNDTATTEIYTLSLHDALPISGWRVPWRCLRGAVPNGRDGGPDNRASGAALAGRAARTAVVAGGPEEHTAELPSRRYLVCPPLLEKKITDNL